MLELKNEINEMKMLVEVYEGGKEKTSVNTSSSERETPPEFERMN